MMKNNFANLAIGMIRELRDRQGKSWEEVAYIMNNKYGVSLSSEAYRSRYRRAYLDELHESQNTKNNCDIEYNNSDTSMINSDLEEKILELKKERAKLSDERIQNNVYLRRIAREDTIKEIALKYADKMNKLFLLDSSTNFDAQGDKEATLLLSDWHYGIQIDNYWNTYNEEVCIQRLNYLGDKVIEACKKDKIKHLNVLNLGDLICGRIHLTLRLKSREDIIQQTMDVSEILAEFLNRLSHVVNITYYGCLDNHSRIEPNKESSLDLESMARMIPWYIKSRLHFNKRVDIVLDNAVDPDIITYEVFNYKIAAVHGHKDSQEKVIQNLSLMTKQNYDVVFTAHRHHFSANEINETVLLSNGSLIGTDDYAKNVRLTAKPSQMLIIHSQENPVEDIKRIVL